MTPPPITTACAWVFIRAAPAAGPNARLFRRYGAGAGEGVPSAARSGVFATGVGGRRISLESADLKLRFFSNASESMLTPTRQVKSPAGTVSKALLGRLEAEATACFENELRVGQRVALKDAYSLTFPR